jgi:precorrin-3B C17-methyltransferase
MRAQEILLKYREPTTPVALVKSAYRFREEIVHTTLAHMLDFEIGMLTTVLVGSTQTYRYEGRMVTPRGYKNKYELADGAIKEGQKAGYSLDTSKLQEVQRPWRS